MELKYSEVLRLNKELENNLTSSSYSITILSNIVVHQIKEILECLLRREGINANVAIGNYDNIVQDSKNYQDSNAIIIFWELCNIIEGLQYKIELLNKDQLNEILEQTKLEIDLVLKNIQKTSLVLINKFTSLSFSSLNVRKNRLEELADKLNQYLENKIPVNARLVELEKVFANIELGKSLDLRYFYSSKALYTVGFFNDYVEYVKPFFMSVNGKSKKALILDCDNTLWKGILGEDGFDRIEMSSRTKDGSIFAEIQAIALALNKQGVLIGLCSKNNPGDVDEVIESHPDMQLSREHITINKSNWGDKVSNLKGIAKELNIGLDSLVFVDDSPFEVNLIRDQLPEVTVFQVPNQLHEYPKMLRQNMGLFYHLSFTAEDSKKIEMYKHQATREAVKKEYMEIDDYLASLGLIVKIYENDESIIPRMSQMSQKTNQFNVTSKRYTEADIKNFVNNAESDVYAFSVSDKFGDSGITGLSLVTVNRTTKTAEIDSFLMSCRVIGRNIEYAFLDYLIEKLKVKKIRKLKATYIETLKNEQVKGFYDKCSFTLVESTNSVRNYTLEMSNYEPRQLTYIDVINE